ncbi:hypothetical protein GCM10017710_49140 [Arthrobacter ramosus]
MVGSSVHRDKPQSAALYAAGLFTEDRRRPIAQWFNPTNGAALLVAPETSPEWPVQRFGIFYAPPAADSPASTPPPTNGTRGSRGRAHRGRRLPVRRAEAARFLQVEMDFV